MKKVLCVLAAFAVVALFSTSCNKTCNCQVWTLGVATGDSYEVELDKDVYNNCAEASTYSEVVKSGIKCK